MGWASTGASYDYIPELKDVETKLDLAFWGTVPTASNLPSLIILLLFFGNPNIYTISSHVHTYWIPGQIL